MSLRAQSGGLEFETAAVTHPGHVRQFNEDSVFTSDRDGVWVVADGMGGHRDGNVASAMITAVAETIQTPGTLSDLSEDFSRGIENVNEILLAKSNGQDHLLIGSTIAALLIRQHAYVCLWAGDSRCYLVRRGRIEQISRDHTEVQDLVDRGVLTRSEARTWPRRNVITRAVGAEARLALERTQGEVQAGDCFILCSDGLTGHVEDLEILSSVQWASAQQASDRLLSLALERGGKDNISIIIVNVTSHDTSNDTTVVVK